MRTVGLIVLVIATACADDSASGVAGGGAGGVEAGVGGAGGSSIGGASGSSSGGAGGSTSGGVGGAVGGGAGTTNDAGPSCKSGTESFHFVVTASEPFKRIALPLDVGVKYRRLELSFAYTATAWSPTCYNPAAGGSTKSGFPAFESLVSLKRGSHWCKGGNLFELTLHGPGSGQGASTKAQAESFYKQKIHTGSGCGTSDVEAKIFSANHGISAGSKHTAKIVFDADQGTLSADLGPTQHQGAVASGVDLIANAGDVWNVVLSFDGGSLECYDSQGKADPTAPCCWLPSIGWVFDDLVWKVCS